MLCNTLVHTKMCVVSMPGTLDKAHTCQCFIHASYILGTTTQTLKNMRDLYVSRRVRHIRGDICIPKIHYDTPKYVFRPKYTMAHHNVLCPKYTMAHHIMCCAKKKYKQIVHTKKCAIYVLLCPYCVVSNWCPLTYYRSKARSQL